MAQRRFHYELAFEHYLRANTIPYVAVDEAKRALAGSVSISLKSFDFVVYSKSGANLLIDVKGRKHSAKGNSRSMQNWVTQEDVDSLSEWRRVFGNGFMGAFVFLFHCETPPPDALFQEVFEFDQKWYAIMAVKLTDYRSNMKLRSGKWQTVDVPVKAFNTITMPLSQLLF